MLKKLSSPQTNSIASNPNHSPCHAWGQAHLETQRLLGSLSFGEKQQCSEKSRSSLIDWLQPPGGGAWGMFTPSIQLAQSPRLPLLTATAGIAFWNDQLDTGKYLLQKSILLPARDSSWCWSAWHFTPCSGVGYKTARSSTKTICQNSLLLSETHALQLVCLVSKSALTLTIWPWPTLWAIVFSLAKWH